MSDFLQQMAASSTARAALARRHYTDDELDAPLHPIARGSFDIIAELKDSSPSQGQIAASDNDRLQRALQYADGGAAAVSVLTEPSRFGGDLAHLREVAAALCERGVPVMRKDFLVDTVQLLEARAAGASGALLIAAMLHDKALAEMLDCAAELGLFVLLEAFDADDLARSARLLERSRYRALADAGALLIGVNTRNLRTLAVDPGRLDQLGHLLPAGVACVAESGLRTPDDAARAAASGYRLALVGTALMQSGQPASLIGQLLAAGRMQINQ